MVEKVIHKIPFIKSQTGQNKIIGIQYNFHNKINKIFGIQYYFHNKINKNIWYTLSFSY